MEAQKNKTKAIRRGKQRPESKHLISDASLELSASNNGKENRVKSNIWDTLEEAKRKQDSIRNRVRKYGHGEEDSGQDDSPLSSNDNKNCEVHKFHSDNSDSESNEYDDEFDLDPPRNNTGANEQNRTRPQRCLHPPPGSISTTRKKSFSGESHRNSFNKSTHESNISMSNKYSMNNQRLRIKYPARKYSFNARKREKVPVLTPEEAIRLVMEQHAYISDSERTEDDRPLPTRKESPKGSSSTNETAMNTVASDSGHNRTSEGKRVLVLRKKKHKKDTHPRTSKNKKFERNHHQEPQTLPSRQQRSIRNHLHIQNKKQQDSTSRILISTKKAQIKVEENRSSKTHLMQSAESDISRPLKSLIPLRQQVVVKEKEYRSQSQRKHGEENIMKKYRWNYQYHNDYVGLCDDNQVDDEDRIDDKKTFVDKRSQQPKNCLEEVRDYEATANKKSKKRALPSALDGETIVEKQIVLLDNNIIDFCSDSDSDDEYNDDDDFLGLDDDIVERSSNPSRKLDLSNFAIDEQEEIILLESEEKNDCLDLHGDDEEEDWRGSSWKTAKTSRSAVSKYSKSSSTSLWMKSTEMVDGGNNEDDDIFFFDAIQEAGSPMSRRSVKTIGAPPTVISNETNKNRNKRGYGDAVEPKNEGGWKGKITNFVGYTISALSGSKDEYDDNLGSNINSVASPNIAASTTSRSSITSESPPKHCPKSPDSPKAVPSRELEIIRKCQELMKSQKIEVETREKEAARKNLADIRLRRKEEEARARVWREVMAYREMMEGMGKGDKLAPLDSKDAAQEYDDRLSMVKTLEDQEHKMKLHERNMMQMETKNKLTNLESSKHAEGRGCACAIS